MFQNSLDKLHTKAFLKHKNYINGHWVQAHSGEVLDVLNPATNEFIGHVPNCTEIETKQAIEFAHSAFQTWSMTTAQERADLLHLMAFHAEHHIEDFATLLTLEQGKPLAEARKEIEIGIKYIKWFAEEARRINGQLIPSPAVNRKILATKEPVGVVGAITPWNFPFSMLARKIAPALAAGCTIVARPSELTPYCGLLWGVLAEEARLPAGVVNIITGHAEAIGQELTSNPLVRKISFTGSTKVGKLLYEQSAKTMKKISMELGGNAPFIVFEDADIDEAVSGGIAGKFRNSGQTCVCVNRFYIHDKIYDEYVQKFADKVKSMKIGSGLEEAVQITPLINESAIEKTERLIQDAVNKGGKIVLGGKRHKLGGNYFEPTIIIDANHNMDCSREELFSPVAVFYRFSSEEGVLYHANNTEFGLASYFYTNDLSRSFRVSRALQTGMVGINAGIITTEVAPFGGVKESGLGSEGGQAGIEEYLTTKYISIDGLK